KIFLVFFIVSLIFTSSVLNGQINEDDPIIDITLVLKTSGGGVRPDYGLFIAQDLKVLGIKVEVKVEEWTVFIGTLLVTRDFDLGIVGLSGGGASPDMYDVYGEDGSLNMFGINTAMPYGYECENMMIEGVTIVDLEERQQHYYDWQQLVMDRIVPILPLYSPRSYVATWANIEGYDGRWGIVDSLPYMEYTGLHEGQVSLTDFNIADANWRGLNPLQTDDTSSSFIFSLMAESIVGWSPDSSPLNNSLVIYWEQIDDFHYKFTMRDGVYWNPSFNVTDRTASSDALNVATTPLMEGLKNGEVSTGTNQQVTAKDAVFTYLAWANPLVSEDPSFHRWISDCYVDTKDPLSFHIEIDGNPDTLEIEQYVDFWARLPWEILPEFFLNSSDTTISYTSGGADCTGLYAGILYENTWIDYSESAFGCGKYMLDYNIPNSVTVLQASPYWMGIGIKEGTAEDLDIETINVRVIPDISAELAEFKAGYLDWTGLTTFPTERKQMQANPDFNVQSFLTASFSFMFYNLRRSFISDVVNDEFITIPGKEEYTKGVALRKAMNYAINRDVMNEEIHDGEYLIANSVLYPFTAYYYYDDIIKYNYDLDASSEWINAIYNITPTSAPSLILAVISLGLTSLYIIKKKKKNRWNQ
ncbi:MAG: ABC transporter substrate-binding protein, partial [Candidatus Heimdallarchaeaceae archaeon]